MFTPVNNWSDAVLAYTAGMVDADGTVYLSMRDSGTLKLRLQVVNTDRTIIDWLSVHFGGYASTVQRTGERRALHKPLHHWHLEGARAIPVLEAIAPFMVIKKARAELAVEAWNNRRATPIADRRQPLPDGVVEMRAGYVERMHEFNRKGA